MFKLFWGILFFSTLATADFQWGADTFLTLQNNEIATSDLNPNNQVFLLPEYAAGIEIRPDFKWTSGKAKFVVRPQWSGFYQLSRSYLINETVTFSKGKLDLSDLFVETTWGNKVKTTIGLQVFQWGPAEFLSPSNPLYHFNVKQRGLFYKEKGQALIRLNFLTQKENSFILLLQPVSNNETAWQEEMDFTPKGLGKFEKTWRQVHYFGVVAGIQENENPFIGEYFNFVPIEGISIYGDLKHSQNQFNYHPQWNGLSYDMVATDSKNDWPTLGVFGVRYESDYDIRFEYIYNQSGFDEQTLKNAILSASFFLSPQYLRNLRRFLKPGLELLGQNYLYSSLRVAEPFSFKELNFYARGIYSLQDFSFQAQVEGDHQVFDSWAGFLNLSHSFGKENSEFILMNNWSALTGIKYSF